MNPSNPPKDPLVHIGVPVYNGGRYLEECLESISKQSYTNWECAVIDNQSTDDTNPIARKFVEKDPRFKLYRNEHFVDQTTNWNISYRKISKEAKYFKIVCADDWIFEEYLQSMVPLMEAREDVGLCSSYRIDGEQVNCDGLDYYSGNYFDGKNILLHQLKGEFDVTGSINTILFRVDTLKRLTYHPEIFRHDVYHIDSVLAYDLLNISGLAFVYKVLSYTRRHNETYTSLISKRFKTNYYWREMELHKFRTLAPALERLYKASRLDYAYFLLIKRIVQDGKCIEWHEKHLDRKFHLNEYAHALLTRNALTRLFKKILRRKKLKIKQY